MHSYHRYFLLILPLSILAIACDPTDEEVQAILIHEVAIKTEAYKGELSKKCQEEARRLAELEVDSIIFARQINPLHDSLYRPHIPERPTYVPVDSIVFESKRSVKPIL